MTAWEPTMAGAGCNSGATLFVSVQAVSLLNPTNPPSVSGTINWRFDMSCAATIENDIRTNARERMASLLLISIAAFDDRELDVIRRFEPNQAHGSLRVHFVAAALCVRRASGFRLRSGPAIYFAINDASYHAVPGYGHLDSLDYN